MDIASPYIKTTKNIGRKSERNPRKLLVDIYAFCLMPNHYHLLLSPRTEGAITKFMKKINIGYAKYFNQKYERKGTLFEGRYKSVNIKDESHFVHIPYYIHLNPLDLAAPEWRERKLKNYKEATRFLEKYRWSSHLDYLGKKNFPSVTNRELLMKFFGGPKEYEKSIKQWLKDIELDDIRDIVLE
jgi:putative transposase